jgi:putative Ca2+/H+ antiporter (TMEM165/GDT1 family)
MDHLINSEQILSWLSTISLFISQLNLTEALATSSSSFALIVAAEMGDKSQLVCMTLASRHRPLPVILGAVCAFSLLNTLAVIFGVAIAQWIPNYIVAISVSGLFALFGIQALRFKIESVEETVVEKSSHSIFFSTFLLMMIAEFGDKTQLAVVGLSSSGLAIAVWLGATAALAMTSMIGVLAGRSLLQKLPLSLLHRFSGLFFLILSGLAAYQGYSYYSSH